MKKFISLLLTAVMLLSAFSFASFAEEIDEQWPFTDVKESAWYYEGIAFCYYNGIVAGMTETTFVPNGTLTRAQFVQILAMYAGADLEPYKSADSGFNDVKTNHWFNAPVCWAVEQGFVAGLSETKFGPNNPITREQLARLLYLYAESQGLDVSRLADLSAFEDEGKVSNWAYPQVQWAVAAGIISGTSETTLSPRATATRAQACRMIMTFDDFVYFGYIDRGGAYEVIVEYIKANGEYFPEESFYSYFKEWNGYDIIMEYSESDESFYIAYLTEPYEIVEGDDTYINYRESGSLYAYSLTSGYDFNYYREDANGTNFMSTYGNMTLDGYEEYGQVLEGYENTDLIDGASNAQAYIREHIALILAEADMTLDDFFLPEESSDVLADLAALTMEYGVLGDTGWYIYYGVEDGVSVSYDENSQSFLFSYIDSMMEYPGMLAKTETAFLFVDGIAEKYPYEYEIDDYNTENVKKASFKGELSYYGYTELEATVTKGSEEEIRARADEVQALLIESISNILEECGHDYSELFYVDETRVMLDQLVDYVCANGVEDVENGVIDLVKDMGNKAYVAEYSIAEDVLYIVYVSEPKAGGTDIYDTEYCEKAILALEWPLEDDEMFIYSYAKEDGTRSISGSATTDGNELLMGEFDYSGYDDTTALNKVNSAFNEVMNYFTELTNEVFGV